MMTGLMHEREFSRKSFLRGSGALVVGFSLAGAGLLPGKAQAAVSPDTSQVDAWLTIHADNTASILTGKVELGQGSATGLLQIAGEELDMDMSQLKFVRHDTNVTPNTGTTSASLSIRQGGPQVRAASVEARKALLGLAATKLGVSVDSLTVASGVVSGGGKSVKYGDLLGDKPFNITMPASYTMNTATSAGFLVSSIRVGLIPGDPGTKPVSQYKLVGTRVPRVEIPDIVSGTHTYVHNVRVPGMLHGRVVRPRGQGAWGTGAPIISVDASSIKHIPDVQIVRKGDFLGVVAKHEYDAIQATAQLKVKWQDSPVLPGDGNLFAQMRKHDSAGLAPAQMPINTGNVDAALALAAHTVRASFSYPYNTHGALGPTCCVADVKPGSAMVLSNTENAYGLRGKLAVALGLPESAVRVQWWEGSSGYGDDAPYDDAAISAALMSQSVGKPVRLQFMRWDEHGWDGYAPAQLSDIRAGVDASGNIVAFDYTTFVIPYADSSVPTASELIGVKPTVPLTARVFDTSRAGAQYNLPNRRLTFKSLPVWKNYFNSGFMRAPDSPQAPFAAEQVIDELAFAAKLDPVAFRLQNVTQSEPSKSRWLALANAVTQAAGWKPKVAASNLSNGNVVTGRGFAMMDRSSSTIGSTATPMAAAVADIEVNKKTGKIVAKHLYVAMDVGIAVNPGLVENQIVGGTTQTVSRALYEQVNFDKNRVTSLDWVTYPILRFKDHPQVTPVVVQRLELPPLGVGQEMVQVIAPALANAFFDATGVRIRQAPMAPGRVRAVLKAAGMA
jgi:nicotinate dehydrogenase subunit B